MILGWIIIETASQSDGLVEHFEDSWVFPSKENSLNTHLSKGSFCLAGGVDDTKKASGQLGRTCRSYTKSPHAGPGFCLKVEILALVSALGILPLRD